MKTISALLVVLLSGCAVSPPLPPQCEGPLVPINGQTAVKGEDQNVETRTSP